MKALELKDIAGYLPYGLCVGGEALDSRNGNAFTTYVRWGPSYNHRADITDINDEYALEIMTVHTNYLKPILRPMSDLYEEITHKGEKFIPITELALRLYPHLTIEANMLVSTNECATWETGMLDHRKWKLCYHGYFRLMSYDIITGRPQTHSINTVLLFDKLNEWMFDYRGLIDAGLAIDVNTLTENPYNL